MYRQHKSQLAKRQENPSADSAQEETWFERERRKRQADSYVGFPMTNSVPYAGPDSSSSSVNQARCPSFTPKFSQTDSKPSLTVFDLNTVTRNDLLSVDHIGTSLADSILKYRQDHTFQSVKQLTKVPHIGTKTYEKISHRFCVNTASSSGSTS